MDGGMKISFPWAPVRAKNETLYGLKLWICLNLMCYKMYPIFPLGFMYPGNFKKSNQNIFFMIWALLNNQKFNKVIFPFFWQSWWEINNFVRFVHFVFFEEIVSRYHSVNSVFSVIEFSFSSDYPSMWFGVRRFNCCPTFIQIIWNGTQGQNGFSLFPSILIIRLLLSPSCDCV